MTESLTVDGVTVRLGDTTVLDGVSARCPGGALTGIIGPNGAGKTTLLRTVAGVHEPERGTVVVGDRAIGGLSPRARARCVSYLPQESGIPFDYTVREIVAMGRYPHTRGRATNDDAVDEALATTRTEAFADRAVSELSTGQRRRVLLARTLAQRTPIVLLDEPTAAMDIRHGSEIRDVMEGLTRDEGRTAIAVMHDLETALGLCDHVVMLDEGDVVAEGEPGSVITEDRVEAVYGRGVTIGEDAATGRPTVSVHRGDTASWAAEDTPSHATMSSKED